MQTSKAFSDTGSSSTSSRHLHRIDDLELSRLFEERDVPEEGRTRIRHIRDNPPGRVTLTSRFAGKLRFPSLKMGFALEAEAFESEFVAIVGWEYDDQCLEMYTQPDHRLKINYSTKRGGRTSTLIRPDAFRITRDAFVFTECKTEAELNELAEAQPARFVKEGDLWRSPPAEESAAKIGCKFEIRSTTQNNFVLHDNLTLLADYLSEPIPEVSSETINILESKMKGRAFLSAYELIHVAPTISADDLYILMLQGNVYFPLPNLRLEDQQTALFFRSRSEWKAHEIFLKVDVPSKRRSQRKQYRVGDNFTWSGVPYSIINPGAKKVSCRSSGSNGAMIDLTYGEIDALERSGDVVFQELEEETRSTAAEDLLARATAKDQAEAAQRYQILFGEVDRANPLISRSSRARAYWLRAYKEAEELHGNGFVGLLPQRHGHRQDKAAPDTKALARELIVDRYETVQRKKRIHVYGDYVLAATEKGLEPISYATFCKFVRERGGHLQETSRVGEKAAYEFAPQYLELERTTPRHGLHSWHIGHIDHTPLPLKFLHSRFAEFADTVWLTILHGSCDRKLRAYYLSFDEPSYRSCMMVMRDCVRRHGRTFGTIVSDGGSEFNSTYWETLLARLGVTKRERLKGKPRHGSTCERVFGTTQVQLVTNLAGSTDVVEQYFRAISPEVEPEKHAIWILDLFDKGFDDYLDKVYHVNFHSGIDMTPDAAEALSLKSHGERKFRRIIYDEQFLALTCPAVKGGTVKVTPQGVKIGYKWFKAPELSSRGIMHTSVPGRYDPDNSGIAYVFIGNRWIKAYSEYYAIFREMSERAIRFATQAMRAIARTRNTKLVMNAQNLATFLMSMQGQEASARQKKNDEEAKVHHAKISGAASPDATAPRAENVIPLRPRPRDVDFQAARSAELAGARSKERAALEDL